MLVVLELVFLEVCFGKCLLEGCDFLFDFSPAESEKEVSAYKPIHPLYGCSCFKFGSVSVRSKI